MGSLWLAERLYSLRSFLVCACAVLSTDLFNSLRRGMMSVTHRPMRCMVAMFRMVAELEQSDIKWFLIRETIQEISGMARSIQATCELPDSCQPNRWLGFNGVDMSYMVRGFIGFCRLSSKAFLPPPQTV